MRILSSFLCASALLSLTSCGYAVKSSNQEITFLSPEAQNAKCHVFVDKLKYQVFPPQTLNIKKSEKDMRVECLGPGNRIAEMTVPAVFTKRAIWGGPPGMAWDYASDSLFHYPEVIAIDFTGQNIQPNPLPQHNNSDIRQPESYDLEQFESNAPRLNEDKYKIDTPLMHRDAKVDEYAEESLAEEEMTVTDSKGDLKSVLDNLSSEPANSDEAVAEPVKIYPGQ